MRSRITSPHVLNIRDLRRLARARLPAAVFDYLDGGAEDEVTLRDNMRAFSGYRFRPRQAVDVREPILATTVMGQAIAMPAMLAPIGYSRLIHPEGEMAAARAAGRAGTGYVQSTVSGYRLEDVAAASAGP